MGFFKDPFAFVIFCFMLDDKVVEGWIVKLDARFIEQAVMDAMGIIYPQY
jgi:hypothetical protein